MAKSSAPMVSLDLASSVPLKLQVWTLARAHGLTAQPTAWDTQADLLARLAGDTVEMDETDRLLMALARAKVLTGGEMLRWLAACRGERHGL